MLGSIWVSFALEVFPSSGNTLMNGQRPGGRHIIGDSEETGTPFTEYEAR
jgi:hypothetical protein